MALPNEQHACSSLIFKPAAEIGAVVRLRHEECVDTLLSHPRTNSTNVLLSHLVSPGDPISLERGGMGVPFLADRDGWPPLPFDFSGVFATNQERNATQVKTRQSLTWPPCVSRLFVR